MTLYLLFERLEAGKIKLDTPKCRSPSTPPPGAVQARPEARREHRRSRTAIRAIVTKSANDVAVVVAEALGGNELEFAKLMTAKARALGMTHTNYHNASGLPDDATDHHGARPGDPRRAPSRTVSRNTSTISRPAPSSFAARRCATTTTCSARVDGVDGIKTGYIHESGFNIIVSMHRNGRHLVAVVFGGRTASARDARVISLIDNNINVASTKRTAPLMVEGWQNQVAQAAAAKEKAAAADAAAGPKATPVAAVEASPPLAAPAGPALGSTDPIKPLPVKTVHGAAGRHAHRLAVAAAVRQPQAHAGAGDRQSGDRHHGGHREERAPPPPAKPVQPVHRRLDATGAGGLRQRHDADAGRSGPGLRPSRAGGWMIQVGAFDSENEAKERLTTAQTKAKDQLGDASPVHRAGRQRRQDALSRPLCGPGKDPGGDRLQKPQAQRNSLHAA